MRHVPAVARAAASVLLLSLAAVGCSQGTQDDATGSSTPKTDGSASAAQEQVSEADRAYYGCLEDAGLVLQTTGEGQLRLDKDKNSAAAVTEAETKCADLQPAPGEVTVSAEDLAAAQELSDCVQGKGIKDYPDPDPKTGELPITDELAAEIKSDPDILAALAECTPDTAGSDTPADSGA